MLALLLVLTFIPTVARAEGDAPVILKAGDPAPVDGLLQPTDLAIRIERERIALRTENEELKKHIEKSTPIHPVVLVVLGVVVLGAGAAAGYGVARAMK